MLETSTRLWEKRLNPVGLAYGALEPKPVRHAQTHLCLYVLRQLSLL
jgi:hypothetical protein